MKRVIPLNRHSGVPLYRQIADDMEADLIQRYEPNGQLPNESTLAGYYGVNRLTIRQAVADLVRTGLVQTIRGKGTFRAASAVRYDVSADQAASFTHTMRGRGHRVETRLIKTRTEEDPAIRSQLGTDAAVHRTDILRLVDGQPWSLTSTWLVPGRFPDLEARWDGTHSLYTVLETRYGVRMTRANRSFAAVAATSADAEWLLVPVATPILQVRGLNVADDGTPVAVVEHRYRGDRLQFTMEL